MNASTPAEPPPTLTPNLLPRPVAELQALERVWATPRGWRLLSAVNNTVIGLFYIGTALAFFVGAGLLALAMRAQLALPGGTLIGPELYNQIFTMHGTVMMFLFAVPVVEAVAVYLLPGMLGARDLPFPRLGAYAFWAYALGGAAFFTTIFFNAAPDGGWFMYPPLTDKTHSPGVGADWWLLGIGFIEISAIAGAIELIIGVLFTRAPGMSLSRMPVFAWAMLVVAAMVVFAFPSVIAGTALLELERALDWPFFDSGRGGDPLLWQHLFWFFGHPEVYIIFLPAAGLVSMMLPTLCGTPLVGRRWVVAALVAVGVLSFALWAHHMFTAGLSPWATLAVSVASLAIAVPSAVQMFAWLATLWQRRLRITGAALFIIGFIVTFAIGGLTGVMVAVLPFDQQAHDSYFVVAHLHYVLIGGMVFPLIAAVYHWTPLVNGHALSERVARWAFGLVFSGFHVTFFPMHLLGMLGMPRRVYTYGTDAGFGAWNAVSSAGAAVLACGLLLLAWDALRTWCRPAREHGDPWGSSTLEWLPSESYGVRSIPQVRGDEPLWQQPALVSEVPAGAHWLPGTLTGGRETLVTTPRQARPSHVIALTGDSWLPLAAAAGTAAFFLLLTVGWGAAAAAGGIAAIVATLAWLWQTDRALAAARGFIGTGTSVPLHSPPGLLRRSHSWWAVAVLGAVDLTVWASFAFAHLHVSMAADVCPPPGAALPPWTTDAGAAAAWMAGSLFMGLAVRWMTGAGVAGHETPDGSARWAQGPRLGVTALVVGAATCAGVGFGLSLAGQWQAGLSPRANAWNATAATLLAYQGLHAAVLMVAVSYVLSRIATGRLLPRARATLDNTALLWHVATAGTVGGLALVQGLPLLLQ